MEKQTNPNIKSRKIRPPRPDSWTRTPFFHHPCTLIYQKQAIPLKKIKYDVEINGALAKVKLSQEYFNDRKEAINATYHFPVNDQVVFEGIEAVFKDRRVQGKIKEKEQAKAEFQANKAKGNTVAFAEQLSETQDIMKIELGNFPAQQALTIVFSYLVTLDIINEVNWGFRIPCTLTPRYNPDKEKERNEYYKYFGPKILTNAFKNPRYLIPQKYPWEINVRINWPGGATNVRTLTHGDYMVVDKAEGGIITVSMKPGAGLMYPNKDFELVLQDQNLFSNQCQVAVSDLPSITGQSPKYAAMMQFVPSMYKWYADQGIDEEKGIDIYGEEHEDFLMDHTTAEYIFILDRSGSMGGTRIKKAKSALIFFLKSLPENSLFNIISFGGGYEPLYPQPVEYNTHNLNKTIQAVSGFKSDMGGTNILKPISATFKMTPTENYQRNIFLLTDGAVSNVNDVITEIETNCRYNTARVFSIGIGNGCSELLVRRSARAGNGKSIIIGDNDNVQGKIVSLLNEALTPSLTNFSVEFDEKYICAIAPKPTQHSHILRGEPFTMYALLKNDIENAPNRETEVKVNFWDSVEERMESRVFKLSLDGCIQDSSFHKIAIKRTIENLTDEGVKEMGRVYLDPKLAAVPNITTTLAVAYQVLSAKHTAFICVIEEASNGKYVPTVDVIVPTLESIDYQEKMKGGAPGLLKKSKPMARGRKMKKGGVMRKSKARRGLVNRDKAALESDGDEDEALDKNSPVDKVILRQEIKGFWKHDADLLTSLGIAEAHLGDLNTQFAANLNVLMTIAVLAWLEINGDQDSISLIVKKGMKFLRKEKVNGYKELIAELKAAISK